MINIFSKKTASQVNLDSIFSEKVTVELDEQQEQLLTGGAIALPSFIGQSDKAKVEELSASDLPRIIIW